MFYFCILDISLSALIQWVSSIRKLIRNFRTELMPPKLVGLILRVALVTMCAL